MLEYDDVSDFDDNLLLAFVSMDSQVTPEFRVVSSVVVDDLWALLYSSPSGSGSNMLESMVFSFSLVPSVRL